MRLDRRFVLAAAAVWALAGATHAEGGEAPDRQQRLTSAASYMPMPTLSAGVIQRFGTHGTIVVDMGLDVQDARLRARAAANAPLIRDALRTALATYATTFYREHTQPDPDQAARLMQNAVDRTLGATGARVLLTNIIFQRKQN